jgi:hypothetical protein
MTIEELVRAELREVADSVEVPLMPSLEADAEGVRRRWPVLVAAAAVGVLLAGGAQLVLRDRDTSPDPSPRPDETPSVSTAPDRGPVPRAPSSGGLVVRDGEGGLSVDGTAVPGRWIEVVVQRGTVWVARHEGANGQPSVWWGNGATTHQLDETTVGFAISPDARWIVWSTPDAPGTDVMQVVDTASGEVRASRSVRDHADQVGPLAVTNDGVVVFDHCLVPTENPPGWPTCAEARLEVWLPGTGVTDTLPLPPSAPLELAPMLVPSGAHNGLLAQQRGDTRKRYLRITSAGEVEVVATLPNRAVAVSPDESFLLISGECAGPMCPWEVAPFAAGRRREIMPPPGWFFVPSGTVTVESASYVVVDVKSEDFRGTRSARCSLSAARCVLVEPPG